MSDQILNILKLCLLALVWLFFLRILRSVWVEIRTGDTLEPAPGAPDLSNRPGVVPAGRRAPAAPPSPSAPSPPAPAPPAPSPPAGRGARSSPVPAPGAGSGAPTALRIVEPADQAGRSWTVEGEITIGRAAAAGISLSGDSYVSSSHARVYRADGRLWVEDRGSTNGTLVNSQKVSSPTPLKAGDRLQVGRTVLEVVT